MMPAIDPAGWSRHGGVGLKPGHVAEILATCPAMGFFEVHAENYMGAGGPPHRHLRAIRERYPVSIHGVGMSIGGADDVDQYHLDRLCDLVRRYEPSLVSEHLAWSGHGGAYLNDLLPIPYSAAALERVAGQVDRVQAALGRTILLENPSTYIAFAESEMEEVDFITEVARRTGCGLLLDVNNVFVSCTNHGRDPVRYLDRFPMHRVGEIHLAGHAARVDSNGVPLLIDSHDRPVAEAVWQLYADVVGRIGAVPTLIERDADIPAWHVLHAEALRAESYMTKAERESCLALAG